MSAVTAVTDINVLYTSHSDWLQEWLRRQTRCSHRAADLAQDTFCRLLEMKEIAPLRNPRHYLVTVARRILIDDIRHREIERAYLTIHAARTGDVEEINPERVAGAVQLLRSILQLLETVPEKARRAFMMVRFNGTRYAVAARRLGVSERMVKRYVAQVYARCYALAYTD